MPLLSPLCYPKPLRGSACLPIAASLLMAFQCVPLPMQCRTNPITAAAGHISSLLLFSFLPRHLSLLSYPLPLRTSSQPRTAASSHRIVELNNAAASLFTAHPRAALALLPNTGPSHSVSLRFITPTNASPFISRLGHTLPFAAPIIAGRQAHHSLASLLQFLANQCLAHCVTKQCQAVTRPCLVAHRNALTSPCRSLLSPGRAAFYRSSSCSRRTHRRRPDQGCAVSVLSKSRLFCAPALPTRSMLCPGFTLQIRTVRNSGTA